MIAIVIFKLKVFPGVTLSNYLEINPLLRLVSKILQLFKIEWLLWFKEGCSCDMF